MPGLPLEGYRAINFGHVWAAPTLGRLLADFGAEVIKVESRRHLDGVRTYLPLLVEGKDIGVSASFLNYNSGVLGMTVDFSKPKGADLIKRLVAKSDVVIENFPPRVLPAYGLDYQHLREVKPDIVMISLPAAGQYGPLRDVMTFGPSLGALAGITNLAGYPEGQQPCFDHCFTDPIASATGVFCVLAALHHRHLTGEGQFIDMAQWEASTCLLGEALMDYVMNQRVMGFQGNLSRWMAPHEAYRCKGNDKWVSIAIKTEKEWQNFRRAIGDPPWTRDERFADLPGRLRHQEELDKHISEWSENHTSYEVMDILQRAGVAAAPWLDEEERLADPHLASRETYIKVDHPSVKAATIYNVPWKLSRTPGHIQRAAPLLGEHNDYVFAELLGLSEEEMARLAGEKVIY